MDGTVPICWEFGRFVDSAQLAFTIVAAIYALYLLRASRVERRASLIAGIRAGLYSDAAIAELLYAIDRRAHKGKIRHRGKLERNADKALRYLDYIGFLLTRRFLLPADIRIFRYEISTILTDSEIIKYIEQLRREGMTLDYLDALSAQVRRSSVDSLNEFRARSHDR